LVGANGDHLRFIPGELARRMCAAGHAEIHNSNGKIKSIRLIQAASTHLVRIGEPSDGWRGVKFTRVVKTDSGVSWIEFHPRSWDYE
jgi:hypothetical protein